MTPKVRITQGKVKPVAAKRRQVLALSGGGYRGLFTARSSTADLSPTTRRWWRSPTRVGATLWISGI